MPIPGLFDSSSRSVSSTEANTIGGQSEWGPVAAVNVGGDKSAHSVQVVHNTQLVDHGAMQVAQNIAGAGLSVANDIAANGLGVAQDVATDGLSVVSDALYTNESVINTVVSMGERVMDGAANLVRDAMREASFQVESALAAGAAAAADGLATGAAITRDAIDSNTLISRDAMDLSRSVVTLTDDLHSTNTQFLSNTFNEFTDTVTRLDASRNEESASTLEAITELATVVQTGGESINANVNKMIAGLAIVTAGFIAWRALA